ncbi:MAG: hypothetical protein ACREBD_01545 [Blastocatellia bacterium]
MTTNRINGKPRRPRQRDAKSRTPEEAQKFQEYIKQLRDWLDSLSDEEHDKALRRIKRDELYFINVLTTYENYHSGGPLREMIDGTLLTPTGKA